MSNSAPDIRAVRGSKRWYVTYKDAYGNRIREYGGINRIKNKSEKEKALQQLLLEIKEKHKIESSLSIKELLEFALKEVRKTIRARTYVQYRASIKKFMEYCNQFGIEYDPINSISKKHVKHFMSYMSESLVNRTVNNHITTLRTIFNFLLELEHVNENPFASVKKLRTESQSHKIYTPEQLRKIREYFEKKDPYLGLWCKFIMYVFIRPAELRMIKIKNIDFENGLLYLDAKLSKTGKHARKEIPGFFLEELKTYELNNYAGNNYLFSNMEVPGKAPVGKNYFIKRLNKMRINLSLTKDYTIYSFRHTMASQMVRNGGSVARIMKATGHKTISSFEKYAKSIIAEEYNDLSDLITERI